MKQNIKSHHCTGPNPLGRERDLKPFNKLEEPRTRKVNNLLYDLIFDKTLTCLVNIVKKNRMFKWREEKERWEGETPFVSHYS